MNFGLIGAAGFIAPKHFQAIQSTGNQLVAAVDPHDCVGRLDSYFPNADFFTTIELFSRRLEERQHAGGSEGVDYVTVCTPNYLHDPHIRLALRSQAHAICEKPLVTNPGDLDALEELESRYDRSVYTVLQLRLLPSLLELRERLAKSTTHEKKQVCLTYITRRGKWYDASWKGVREKSGGVAMNIGIHFFDLLGWLFGEVESQTLHLAGPRQMAGVTHFAMADVRWFLSTDADDLPNEVVNEGGYAYRSMTLDGQEIEFSSGFNDLHTRVYQEILSGRGTGIRDARPAVELAYEVSRSDPTSGSSDSHPLVSGHSAIPKNDHRSAA